MADENQTNPGEAAGAQAQQGAQFNIQRIYTKDISFESPNAPAIFTKEWKPEIKLDIDTSTNKLEENVFEVVLSVTVTATLGEEQHSFVKCNKQVSSLLAKCQTKIKRTHWARSARICFSHMRVKPFLTWLTVEHSLHLT